MESWPPLPPAAQSVCVSSNHTNLDQNVTRLDLLSDCCPDITLRASLHLPGHQQIWAAAGVQPTDETSQSLTN